MDAYKTNVLIWWTFFDFVDDSRHPLWKKNIQPEDFKDRIIFMSMFNDIECRHIDQR